VSNRSIFATLTLLKKVIVTNEPVYLAERLQFSCDVRIRLVRGSEHHLRVPQHRTDKARGAFWVSGPLLWNDLPDSFHLVSMNSFKCKLKKRLLDKQ